MSLLALGLGVAAIVAACGMRWLKSVDVSEDTRLLSGGFLALATSILELGAIVAQLFHPSVIGVVRDWPMTAVMVFSYFIICVGGRGVFTLTSILFDWVTDVENPRTFQRVWLLECGGMLVLGAWIGLLVPSLEDVPELIARLAIGLAVGVWIFAAMCLAPWVRLRQGGLKGLQSQGLERWLDEVRVSMELPNFRVRIEPRESLANAEASSSPLGNLIVLNRGVFDLSESAQRAILAHEIGHLTGKDSRNQFVMLTFVACLYVQFSPFASRWVYQGDWLIGLSFLACFFFAFYAVLPSILQHRSEFRADAAAAGLLEDEGASMIEALEALRPHVVEESSLTHPSIDDRIAALRQLAHK